MKIKIKYNLLLLTMAVSVNTSINSAVASILVAKPNNAEVIVNNEKKDFTVYNIGGNNYFKIRELASAVNGTSKQFNVEWDDSINAVNLVSSKSYDKTEQHDNASGYSDTDTTAVPTNAKIYVNGNEADFKAYNIGGSNYFMLRDVMETFDINVSWNENSGSSGTVGIDTNKNYGEIKSDGQLGMSAQDIYKKCSQAVFYIETYDMNNNSLYTGSGFFINSTGRAVTNFHVLEEAFSANIYLTDGRKINIDTITAFDIENDLVVFQVKGSDFQYLEIGSSENLSGGEKIFAIGSPLGLDNTISEGVISNPNRKIYDTRLLQISAPISSGSSGGALINNKGQVVGVTSSGLIDGQNLNFALPIEYMENMDLNKNPISLKDMARKYAIYSFNNRPKGFERVVDEGEPNDLVSEAGILENGVSVSGFIDKNGNLDNFYATGTTKGTLKITCFSESEDMSDILIMLNDSSNTTHKVADLIETEDNTKFLYVDCYISEPSDFIISFASTKLYKEKDINIDYVFYYEFMPDM